MERILGRFRFKCGQTMADNIHDLPDFESMMVGGVTRQICPRQFEERGCRTGPALLQMHKRPRKLDQPLVECPVGAMSVRQPKFFQNVMGFVEQLLVEAFQIAKEMGGLVARFQ